MNNNKKLFLYSSVGLTFLALVASSERIAAVTSAPEAPVETQTAEFSTVVNPSIPSSVTFAGKKVDLDPTHMWERLDRELTAMTYTHGNTLLGIKRANRYFPILAPILKKNGIPSDMIYLAVIESTLNPRALSPAKAGGLWQLMPATGKEYGLEVNEDVDERYDPVKATEAASRYLKTLMPNMATGSLWRQATMEAWPVFQRSSDRSRSILHMISIFPMKPCAIYSVCSP